MLRLMMSVCLGWTCTAWAGTAHAERDLHVVVIMDNSGSMAAKMDGGQPRIVAARSALLRVLDQSPPTSQVGVLLLNPGPTGEWLIPLGPIDRSQLKTAVKSLQAGGSTPLGEKMKTGADALLKLRAKNHYGTYKMLIVSDGEATDPALVQKFLPRIQSRGILVDVIGVDMAQQHSLATRSSTYRNASDPRSLEEAISDVVLGESSASSDDAAGQSDFELLSGLPDQVATASLTALTSASNDPIDTSPATQSEQVASQSPAATPGPVTNTRPPPEDSRYPPFLMVMIIVISIVILRAVFTNLKSKP